jgi:hypothetical protein
MSMSSNFHIESGAEVKIERGNPDYFSDGHAYYVITISETKTGDGLNIYLTHAQLKALGSKIEEY